MLESIALEVEAMDFKEFMKMVDKTFEAEFGLGSDDLPDLCYYDFYEDELSPQDVLDEMKDYLGY